MPDRDQSRDQSQDERPAPFSTQDCDLRGLQWMPLNAEDLLDSELFLESTGDEFKAAIALICKSWRQVPAGSLPNSDNSLATLSMARDWTSVRTMALRNWVLCSDGRYYHPIVAAKAMEALPMRQEYVEKKSAEAERKERERRDRKAMFDRLRAAGIVMKWDTKTGELRAAIAKLGPDRDLSHQSRDDASPPTGATEVEDGACAINDVKAGESQHRGELLPTSDDESRDQSRPLSRDKSRLRQGQGQGLVENPSGSLGATPASPSPPAAKKKRNSNVGEQPPDTEPLTGDEQRSTRPWRRCPRGFVVTEAMVQWANDEYPILTLDELKKETRALRNHRFKTGRIEWVPTWENWIKEAADRKTGRVRPAAGFTTSRERQIAQHMPGIAAGNFTPPRPPPRRTPPPATEVIDAEHRPARLSNDH